MLSTYFSVGFHDGLPNCHQKISLRFGGITCRSRLFDGRLTIRRDSPHSNRRKGAGTAVFFVLLRQCVAVRGGHKIHRTGQTENENSAYLFPNKSGRVEVLVHRVWKDVDFLSWRGDRRSISRNLRGYPQMKSNPALDLTQVSLPAFHVFTQPRPGAVTSHPIRIAVITARRYAIRLRAGWVASTR